MLSPLFKGTFSADCHAVSNGHGTAAANENDISSGIIITLLELRMVYCAKLPGSNKGHGSKLVGQSARALHYVQQTQ